MKKINLALLGSNISHSLSPSIYKRKLKIDHDYDLLDFDSSIPSLNELAKKYDGMNITAPHKRAFLNDPLLVIDEDTKALNAINCLKFKDSKVSATNTDYYAIKKLFPKIYDENISGSIFLLGDGAMGTLFKFYFESQGVEFTQLSRRLGNTFSEKEFSTIDRNKTHLIINCLSRDFVFSEKLEFGDWVFWDINYSHNKQADFFSSLSNFRYIDGEEFLETQADGAIEFWGFPSL